MRKSKQRVISIFILSICYGITSAAESLCGDWKPYKDEKCFKIIDEALQTYDHAEKICNQQENSATLVIIRSKDEQDFLSNLLFNTHKVVDNVWIGVKYTSNKFMWIDDSELSFTNWAGGNPTNQTRYNCVQMMPDLSIIGKWVNEPCEKKNLVVCQKNQIWSLSRLQNTLQMLRNSLEDIKKQMNNQQMTVNNQQSIINNLMQNPVPIGFIYTQLPGQPKPMVLWPNTQWEDVSSYYSGLFFRVVGGEALSFGSEQNENAPRIVKITREQGNCMGIGTTPLDMDPGKESFWLWTGLSSPNCSSCSAECSYGNYLKFKTSDGEVRPRNKAIQIWKRIK